MKQNITIETLCAGLPYCFQEFMEYARNLGFEQKPDYKYIRSLFDMTFSDMFFKLDYEFCWHTKKQEILEQKLEAEKIERERADEKLQEKIKK
jgi:hypothetical protein